MSTIIRATDSNRETHGVAFNFDDMTVEADRYLAKIRTEAARIVVKAQQEAESIRQRPKSEGRQAAMQAVEDNGAQAINHGDSRRLSKRCKTSRMRGTHGCRIGRAARYSLAAAIAKRLIRRELSQQPEITLSLVREALELAAGSSQLRNAASTPCVRNVPDAVSLIAMPTPPRARARRSGHRHHPAHALRDLVEPTALGVRAGLAEAREARVHEPRVARQQHVGPDAEAVLHARPQVLDEHVGAVDQREERVEARRGAADRARPTACCAGGSRCRSRRCRRTRVDDLHDVGTEVGELTHARRVPHRARVRSTTRMPASGPAPDRPLRSVGTSRPSSPRMLATLRVVDTGCDQLHATVADGIGTIVFDNPEKHNAMTGEMLAALGRRHAAPSPTDPAVRVVVVRGAGERAFVSGADINQLGSGEIGTPPPRRRRRPAPPRRMLAVGKPVHRADPRLLHRRRRDGGAGGRLRHLRRRRVVRDPRRQARRRLPARGHHDARRTRRPRPGGRDPVLRTPDRRRRRRCASASSTTSCRRTARGRSCTQLAREIADNAPLSHVAHQRSIHAAVTGDPRSAPASTRPSPRRGQRPTSAKARPPSSSAGPRTSKAADQHRLLCRIAETGATYRATRRGARCGRSSRSGAGARTVSSSNAGELDRVARGPQRLHRGSSMSTIMWRACTWGSVTTAATSFSGSARDPSRLEHVAATRDSSGPRARARARRGARGRARMRNAFVRNSGFWAELGLSDHLTQLRRRACRCPRPRSPRRRRCATRRTA